MHLLLPKRIATYVILWIIVITEQRHTRKSAM